MSCSLKRPKLSATGIRAEVFEPATRLQRITATGPRTHPRVQLRAPRGFGLTFATPMLLGEGSDP